MTYTAAEYDDGPIAFRYPRGNGTGVALPAVPEKLEIGKGRIVRQGKAVAILSLGTRLAEALKAADTLEARGLSTSVIDRSEEHTSELQSLMRISYAVFCLKKKKKKQKKHKTDNQQKMICSTTQT